jgi:hypothetical protein
MFGLQTRRTMTRFYSGGPPRGGSSKEWSTMKLFLRVCVPTYLSLVVVNYAMGKFAIDESSSKESSR